MSYMEHISSIKNIDEKLYLKLKRLGIIDETNVRNNNIGESNYSEHLIQPWSVWLDYPNITPWDCDIIKRVLRTKIIKNTSPNDARIKDYEKIIHICRERIRQIKCEGEIVCNDIKLEDIE